MGLQDSFQNIGNVSQDQDTRLLANEVQPEFWGCILYSADAFEHLFQNIGNASQDQDKQQTRIKRSLAASQTIAQSPWLWHEIPANNQINLDRFSSQSSIFGIG